MAQDCTSGLRKIVAGVQPPVRNANHNSPSENFSPWLAPWQRASLNLDWAGIVQHWLSGDFKANLIREWCIIFQRLTCFRGTLPLLQESRIS